MIKIMCFFLMQHSRPHQSTEVASNVNSCSQVNVTFNWHNITTDLFECVKDLGIGELVHDENFSAFEAMSAIELMDPKMDAGMVLRQMRPRTFSSAVQSGVLPLDCLETTQLITVMDASMASFVSWLEGNSLAQTVFTNLYFHDPHSIKNPALKAFSLGVLRMIWLCREIIMRADVCEEEDFQNQLYNFYFAADGSLTKVYGMLKEVDDDVQKQIRIKSQSPSSLQTFGTKEMNGLEAVSGRLRFVRIFLNCLAFFSSDETVHNFTASKPQSLTEFVRLLNQCTSLLQKISGAVSLGQMQQQRDDGNYDWLFCVEPYVNQRLLPPTFPRQTLMFTREAAWAYLKDLVNRFLNIGKVSLHSTDFGTTLDFFREFSNAPNCVLSRSALLLFYIPGKSVTDMVYTACSFLDATKEAIKNFSLPPAFVPKFNLLNDLLQKRVLDDFLMTCSKTLLGLLQISCNNRARQRDKLAAILDELIEVHLFAQKVDDMFNTALPRIEPQRSSMGAFGSYIVYHTVVIMIEYLHLGFELELYAMHEYVYMYWYLNSVLYKWLLHVLQTASRMVTDMENYLAKHDKTKRDKKANRMKKKTKQHRLEMLRAEAQQKMCEGYYRAFLGFHLLGKVQVPEFIRNSQFAAFSYDHRFVAFRRLTTPQYADYAQYRRTTGMNDFIHYGADCVFNIACSCFESARSFMESQPDMQNQETLNLLRICKINVIVLKLLASGHKTPMKVRLTQ